MGLRTPYKGFFMNLFEKTLETHSLRYKAKSIAQRIQQKCFLWTLGISSWGDSRLPGDASIAVAVN